MTVSCILTALAFGSIGLVVGMFMGGRPRD
jgi:hypothetical protein